MESTLSELTNEELWRLFPIVLVPYKSYWPERYQEEQTRLVAILGKENIYRINHIGSTSVPGMLAKPTIDILLEVFPQISPEKIICLLQEDSYQYSVQPANPAPHMMFMKGYTPEGFRGQVFHLHIRYPGDWDELYFRDYLLKYPEVAREYEKLKLSLKEKYEYNRDAYTEAKTDFITAITLKARKESGNKYRLHSKK